MTLTFERQPNGDETFNILITAQDSHAIAIKMTKSDEEMIKLTQSSDKASDKLRMLAYLVSILEEEHA